MWRVLELEPDPVDVDGSILPFRRLILLLASLMLFTIAMLLLFFIIFIIFLDLDMRIDIIRATLIGRLVVCS
jgi:hypothetical protein